MCSITTRESSWYTPEHSKQRPWQQRHTQNPRRSEDNSCATNAKRRCNFYGSRSLLLPTQIELASLFQVKQHCPSLSSSPVKLFSDSSGEGPYRAVRGGPEPLEASQSHIVVERYGSADRGTANSKPTLTSCRSPRPISGETSAIAWQAVL